MFKKILKAKLQAKMCCFLRKKKSEVSFCLKRVYKRKYMFMSYYKFGCFSFELHFFSYLIGDIK